MARSQPTGGDEAPAPARRLTPKGQATRARLVDLAGEVFATEGYASASVREIARRTGLSSGAIYGTFRGKAELLAEAVDALLAIEVDAPPENVLEQTLPEIDAYQFAHAPERDRLRTLLMEAAAAARTDTEIRSRLRDALESRIDLATEAHEEWQEEAGVDPAIDMRALVVLLWSADLGLGVLGALGIETPAATDWSALMLRLLQGVEAPGAQPGTPSRRTRRSRP